MSDEKRVLMCGSSLDYQGGMVSVVKNYLSWRDWASSLLTMCLRTCLAGRSGSLPTSPQYFRRFRECSGAMMDFLAGTAQRALEWASRMGVEWLWRFLRETKRLFRRYFVDSWHFLVMARRSKGRAAANAK